MIPSCCVLDYEVSLSNNFKETIQGRKLFKGGNYSRKYGIHFDAKFLEVVWLILALLRIIKELITFNVFITLKSRTLKKNSKFFSTVLGVQKTHFWQK